MALVPTDESKEIMKKNVNKCGVKSDILLDQKLITQMIMIKNYENYI